MKNIQVIDGALNCTYDIFSIEESLFCNIFIDDTDVEFVEDFYERIGDNEAKNILNRLWTNRLDKKNVNGIHGTLFYGLLDEKKKFYPTKKESEMVIVIP